MSEHHVLEAATGHINLSPVGFNIWANHFLMCRKSFTPPEGGFSPVPYFLLCLAIELDLKARHLETRNQLEVKNEFGHDLVNIYNGLPIEQRILSGEELAVLIAANSVYDDIAGKGGFKYFPVIEAVTGFKSAPPLDALDALAMKLVRPEA